ncbi:MAG: hypothetical protein D6723_00635 [Acidobacteria bacterium]|nr:MAG: hypothetical protein D6723_00635 [Acidobacteriota bacterium]
MKLSRRVIISVIVMALLVAGALFAQYRAMSPHPPIHITAEQVELMINAMPERQRAAYADPDFRRQRLTQLQEALILGAEARRLGYTSRPEIVYNMNLQRDLLLAAAYRKKHPEVSISDEELDAYFGEHPRAVDEFLRFNPRFAGRGGSFRQRLRRQLGETRILAARARQEGLDRDPGVALQLRYFPQDILREAFIRELQKHTWVSEAEINTFYRRHLEEFTEVHVRHILFSTRPSQDGHATPPDREAVRRRALEVLHRARAGEDFAALARQYSDDAGTREQGGDVGYLKHEQMTPQYEEVAFKLKPGEISDLVETPFGFYIIKVEDRRTMPLDRSLRGVIENRLRQRKLRRLICDIARRYPAVVDGARRMTECER